MTRDEISYGVSELGCVRESERAGKIQGEEDTGVLYIEERF